MPKMKIRLSAAIYSIDAILSACYSFLERAYFIVDEEQNGRHFRIGLEPKKENQEKPATLKQAFMNELIYCALRHRISENTKTIREYIVGRALSAPSDDLEPEGSDKSDYLDDPLGIAVPWEEKYGKKEKKRAEA